MPSEPRSPDDRLAALVARHDQGDHTSAMPEAEALLEEIIGAGTSASDPLRIRCVEVVCLLRRNTGDLEPALSLITREIAEEGGHSPRLLMAQAQLEQAIGRWDEAIALALRAEATAAADGIQGHGAECATLAARWLIQLGDLQAATTCLARADARFEELAPVHRAAVLEARADLARCEGRPEAAEAWQERRLALAREAQLDSVEASSLQSLGQFAWRRGERQLALKRFKEERAILECLQSGSGLARTANNLAEAHRELGELDEAQRWYHESLRHLTAADSDVRPIVETNLGMVQLQAGDLRGAARTFAGLEERVAARPVLRVVVSLGRIPALALDGSWRPIDAAIDVAQRSIHELSAHDTDLVTLVPLAVDAMLTAATRDAERARAARLLAFLHDWAARFGRPEAATALQQLRRLAAEGALVPVGPFTLVSPIGEGASSTVWLARHARRRLEVALKILRTDARTGMVQDELAAVARLDHPNIVYLLHYGEVGAATSAMFPQLEPGTPWLAVELAPTGTLADVAGRLAWPSCRVVLLALLDALAHAHARGVLHLDLKPANVLLTGAAEAPVPKLADFGLARLVGGPRRRTVAGSPAYMAPEQFLPNAELVPQSDLYAVGCLATTLLQGAPPFDEPTLDEIRRAHTFQPPPPLNARVAVPEGLDGWLRRLLAKSVGARFRSAAEAARALRALPEVTVLPTHPGAPPPTAADWSATTLILEDDPVTVPLPAAEAPISGDMPLPSVWRRGRARQRSADVVEAGLGLFRIRVPRLVGREAERDRLWQVLRDALQADEPRIVVLEGAPGLGTHALAAWLAERAAELGVAKGVVRLEVPELPLPQDGPAVYVVVGGAPGLRDHPDAVALTVGPLPDEELAEALDARLPLVPSLRQALLRWSAGRPGVAMGLLRSWVEDERLVRRAAGWELRPGTPVPW